MLLRIVVMVLTFIPSALLVAIGIRNDGVNSIQLFLIPLLSSFLLACFYHQRLSRGILLLYWAVQTLFAIFLLFALLGVVRDGTADAGAMAMLGWCVSANATGIYLAYISQKKYRLADSAERREAEGVTASFTQSSEGLMYMRRAQRVARLQAVIAVILCSLGYNAVRQLEHLQQHPEVKSALIGETAVIAALAATHFLAKTLLERWKKMSLLLVAGLTGEDAREKMQLRGDALVAAVESGKAALYSHNPAQANIWRDKVIGLLQDKYKITPWAAAREMADNGAVAFDAFCGVKAEKRANDICKRLAKTHRNDPAVFVSIAAEAARPASL